jgi:predicted peptidase
MISIMKRLLVATTLITLSGCSSPKPVTAAKMPAPQMVKQFKFKSSQSLTLNYLLFLPKDYRGQTKQTWPLMLFLHGAGERGSDVWKVAIHGPPKRVTENPDFPFILVSPQCPEGKHWANDVLLALLQEITRKYSVDTNRMYLTGLSMGGYGTWSLGVSYPEKFAAIAPICGGGDFISVLLASRDKPQALKTLGVWAFHGAKDPVVPVAESQRMVDLLKKQGVEEVKLTVYPKAEHNSWAETYENPELYSWFLKHSRAPAQQ